jgi:hypothetical protein
MVKPTFCASSSHRRMHKSHTATQHYHLTCIGPCSGRSKRDISPDWRWRIPMRTMILAVVAPLSLGGAGYAAGGPVGYQEICLWCAGVYRPSDHSNEAATQFLGPKPDKRLTLVSVKHRLCRSTRCTDQGDNSYVARSSSSVCSCGLSYPAF